VLTQEKLDECVSVGLDEGLSVRAMAAAIGCDRGKVARSVARVRKAAAQPAASPRAQAALARLATAPADPPPREPTSMGDRVRAQLEAAIATGDLPRLEALSRVLKRLPAGEQAEPDPLDAGPQWDALDATQMSCLGYLVAFAAGQEIDADADPELGWWASLFARIPARPLLCHPAHCPLPSGNPEGPAYYVPASSDSDPVAREVKRLTEGRA
jgi:hypothetical protein